MALNSQITSLVFVLLVVQITKQFDLTNPDTVFWIRIVYAAAQTLILLCCYYIYTKITKANDQTVIKVTEPPKPFSGEAQETKEMTITEYDISELKKLVQQTAISIAILAFLHYKFEYVQPLVLQSIFPFKNLFGSSLCQIHLFGKKATGTLQRPWKADNPFGDLMGQQQQQEAPKKSVKNKNE